MLIDLIRAIHAFSQQYIDSGNDWYEWREINSEKLPPGIILPDGNQYQQNIALKKALHNKWNESTTLTAKQDLVNYYVETWGGIRTNSEEAKAEFVQSPSQLISTKGKSGIASWSKAIVVQNPFQYAIYDARVSISLNCLQVLNDCEPRILFPVLPSRNGTIKQGNSKVSELSKKESWVHADDKTFYLDYLEVLRTVAVRRETDISTIEMLLFAKAEVLVLEAFKLDK